MQLPIRKLYEVTVIVTADYAIKGPGGPARRDRCATFYVANCDASEAATYAMSKLQPWSYIDPWDKKQVCGEFVAAKLDGIVPTTVVPIGEDIHFPNTG